MKAPAATVMHVESYSRRGQVWRRWPPSGRCRPLPSSRPRSRRTASKSIGIQIGAVSFVDEGTEKVLDLLQERGAVDTIYLTTFTYGRGLAGRQIPGQPFPDHGVQESDERRLSRRQLRHAAPRVLSRHRL